MEHEIRTLEGGTRVVDVTPRRAIKLFCQECLGWERKAVFKEDCGGAAVCALYPFRNGRKTRGAGSPLKTIRRECRACMGGDPRLIHECSDPHCCFYPYRRGRKPVVTKIGSELTKNVNKASRGPFWAKKATISPDP